LTDDEIADILLTQFPSYGSSPRSRSLSSAEREDFLTHEAGQRESGGSVNHKQDSYYQYQDDSKSVMSRLYNDHQTNGLSRAVESKHLSAARSYGRKENVIFCRSKVSRKDASSRGVSHGKTQAKFRGGSFTHWPTNTRIQGTRFVTSVFETTS